MSCLKVWVGVHLLALSSSRLASFCAISFALFFSLANSKRVDPALHWRCFAACEGPTHDALGHPKPTKVLSPIMACVPSFMFGQNDAFADPLLNCRSSLGIMLLQILQERSDQSPSSLSSTNRLHLHSRRPFWTLPKAFKIPPSKSRCETSLPGGTGR